MDSYQLSTIVENVQLPPGSVFSIDIRFPHFEWCSVGKYRREDLPCGAYTLFLPPESLIHQSEINIDVRIECDAETYSGTLDILKEPDQAEFYTRGVTVLYNESSINKLLLTSLVISLEQIRPPTPPEPPVMVTSECQTEKVHVKDEESQFIAEPSEEKAVGTSSRVVEHKELEKCIETAVEEGISLNFNTVGKQKIVEVPKDLVSDKSNAPLGFNVVPRLSKLSVLDQMIGNRQRLLDAMENTLNHSDIRQKMEYIRRHRAAEKREQKSKDKEKVAAKREEKLSRERKKEVKSSSSEKSSESNNEEGSSSGSSSDASSSSSGSSEGETSSESSSSTSQPSKKEKAPVFDAKEEDSSIEDLFSPKKKIISTPSQDIQKKEDPPKPLSPTSQYLKDLREKILREKGLI